MGDHATHEGIRAEFEAMRDYLEAHLPGGADKAKALRRLDQCELWADNAVGKLSDTTIKPRRAGC